MPPSDPATVRLIAPDIDTLVAQAEAGRVLADGLSTERPWTELAEALAAYRKEVEAAR